MSDRKPVSVVLPAVVIALVLGLYVGGYYAVVRPITHKFQNMIGASKLVISPRYGPSDEEGSIAKRVFAPIHWIDRRIRPRTWGGPIPTKEEWEAFHTQGFPRRAPAWDPSKPPW